MRSQISRAGNHTPAAWFEVEKSWTKGIGADISLALTSFREGGVGDEMWSDDDDEDEDDDPVKGAKRREIALVVQDGRQLSRLEANSLFEVVSTVIANAPELNVTQWTGGELGGERRMVWNQWYTKASRKVVRPVVERAVEEWYGQPIFSRGN
jgi:exopolyphosphatase